MLDLIIAAVAGFVSFISPCVLPLVPAYIGYMGGRMTNTVSTQVSASSGGGAAVAAVSGPSLSMRFNTFLHGLAFVGGFTFIFVMLGLISTAFIQTFGSTATIEGVIGRVGGIAVIFFGLHFMGVLPSVFNWLRRQEQLISSPLFSIAFALFVYVLVSWGFTNTLALWDTSAYPIWSGLIALVIIAFFLLWMFTTGAFTQPKVFWNQFLNSLDQMLYADTRRQVMTPNKGLTSSAMMGLVFAAGWTPCIGPTLGLALTMAANGGNVAQATGLMAAYSLGLGIPFLITALMLDSAQGALRGIKQHMNTIKLVSGAFLVFIGVLVASGRLQDISRQFSVQFGDLSVHVEQCVIGTLEGDITWSQAGTCLSGDEDYETLRRSNLDAEQAAITGETTTTQTDTNAALDTASIGSITDAAEDAGPVIGLAVGNRAPNFETTTLDGETVSLSDFRGQTVLLNFWFTECSPCRVEMPEFERAWQEYGDEGFVILAVNREESADDIQPFAEELGLSFPLLLDEDGDINYEYGVLGYPSTFILDKEGVIQFRAFNALTESQIQELIAEQLS